MSAAPLEGVRVVDLTTGIPGGYAGKLLRDAGADVLHVEPPGGDPLRAWSASERSRDAHGDGVLFRYLHGGKRSLVLDLERGADRARLFELYAGARLVLESGAPGRLDALGLGAGALQARSPAASLISITPFGQTGPWCQRQASEFLLQAWSGCIACRGRGSREPVQIGGGLGEWVGGTCAAVAALAALRRADRCGRGDALDVSLLEAMTPTFTNLATVWGALSGIGDLPFADEFPSVHPTRDGWIGFCIFTGQQWSDFTLLIEHPELREQRDLDTMMGRIARGDEIRGLIDAYCARFTTDELAERAELLRVPVAPIGNGESLPRMEHFGRRGSFVRNPRGGFLQPRVPYLPQRWDPLPAAAAPRLDEHARATDPPPVPPPAPRDPCADDAGPLAGVRVLDLTAFWAGPHAGLTLAALGADVIHVESIQRPDGMRFGSVRPPGSDDWWEWGPTFHAANLGKRGITLDLSRPRGVELARALIAVSDVVIENFSPRVVEQFGLDADGVARANPRAILVRMPAFGLDGPWRERVGFAQTMEQLTGIAWLTGYRDDGPMNARGPMDPLAGLHAVLAVLLGLEHRDRTGEGGAIESIMAETALSVVAEPVLEHDVCGELLTRDGNRSRRAAPQGVYPCAPGAGAAARWVALSVETGAQWRALARCIGREDLADDPGLVDRPGRAARHDELDAAISAWSSGLEPDAALAALLEAGVPAAAVTGSRRAGDLEQLRARGFFEPVAHPVIGEHPMPGMPWRFERGAKRTWTRPAPRIGEHNAEVLGALLGLSEADLEELRAEGIIGARPLGL